MRCGGGTHLGVEEVLRDVVLERVGDDGADSVELLGGELTSTLVHVNLGGTAGLRRRARFELRAGALQGAGRPGATKAPPLEARYTASAALQKESIKLRRFEIPETQKVQPESEESSPGWRSDGPHRGSW